MNPTEFFRFEAPWVLVALVLVPFALWWQLRRRDAVPSLLFSDTSIAASIRPTWRVRATRMLPWLRALVLALGIVALARPQLGTLSRAVHSLGVDIALSIDVSGSMQTIDLRPNRLEAAKAAATEFVSRRASDRISVVIFGEDAAVLCPPTLDRDTVNLFIQSIENEIIPNQRTAIGQGLALAVDRLKDSEAKSKVVVLLTDGVNNSGLIEPLQAAQAAKALGVRVYTIGVGREGTAFIPQTGALGRQQLVRTKSEIDERTLIEIAEATGGRFYRAEDAEKLASIYAEIDQLERTQIETEETADYNERFFLLWGPALLLLGLELLLRALVLARVP